MAFDGTNNCWNPRVPIGDNATRRMRVAQANKDGYQQRIADGINVIERKWSLAWETKPKTDLMAMSNYLAARRGYAFPFKHPVTGVMHNVYCDEWDVSWDISLKTATVDVGSYSASIRYGTMTAEFRKANGNSVLPYPQWVPDPSEIPAARAIDFVNNRSWDRFKGAGDAEGELTVTRASIGMVNDTNNVWRVVDVNEPRRSNRGLLVERASTNAVRNSTFTGAVPGSPGTQPAGWSMMNAASGVTYTIVGTGTEDGVDYIDIRWVGTNTGAAAALGLWYPANSSATTPVANGERWTASTFVRLMDGDYNYIDTTDPLNPVTHSIINPGVVVWEALESGAAQGTGSTQVVYRATDDDLVKQRNSASRAISVALTTRIFMQYRMTLNPGVKCDITLRFGLPQLEKCEFATSPIPTTGTVLTRAADVVLLKDPSFIKTGTGTFYVKSNVYTSLASRTVGPIVPFSWLSVVGSNFQDIYLNQGSGFTYAQSYAGAGNLFDAATSLSATLDTASHKLALASATDNAVFVKDGALTAIDTTMAVPAGPASRVAIGSYVSATYFIDGFVQEVAYWPQRLTNAQLSEVTSV